jgi:hypothetical protein
MEQIDISNITLPIPTNRIGLEEGLRNLRNQLLRDNVDTINPIRYAALTDAQRTELTVYRQALLDIPQQTTWPRDFEWPTKPTWL